MLMGVAVLVVAGVVGLAWITVPDEPSFVEALEEAEAGGDATPFVPDAIGARLTLSGAREGTIDLEPKGNGPNFGLGNSKTQVYVVGGPLAVSQMDHDGLSFFPDPEDCEFTTGEHNEAAGIVAVHISCPELVDIRGNGTLEVEGQMALPAGLVLSLEIPETGGVLTVGDEQWEVSEPLLLLGDIPGAGSGEVGLWLTESDHLRGVFLAYQPEIDTLRLAKVRDDEGMVRDVESSECSIDDRQVLVINPDARLMELTLSCDVEIPDLGSVEGTILYERINVPAP